MRRVRAVSICSVQEGMVLLEDIVSEDGQVLLAQGIQLTRASISQLRKWNVSLVKITPLDDPELGRENSRETVDQIVNQTEYNLFYHKALQGVKDAFQTTWILKQLPVSSIEKLVNVHIGPLINVRGSLTYLQKVQAHCDYTYRHSINVAILSGILGKLVGMTKGQIKDVVMAGLLHDIGKISITVDILNKPGTLTEEEMTIMKTHAYEGYELLLQSAQIAEEIKVAVLQHHERGDGSGYPFGLTESKISYFAKIIAIADIYDAMTSDRIYRKKLTPFHAAETIKQQMYRKLDPVLCLKFLRQVSNYLSNSVVLLSNGQEAKVVYQQGRFSTKPIVKLTDGTCLNLEKNKKITILSVVN